MRVLLDDFLLPKVSLLTEVALQASHASPAHMDGSPALGRPGARRALLRPNGVTRAGLPGLGHAPVCALHDVARRAVLLWGGHWRLHDQGAHPVGGRLGFPGRRFLCSAAMGRQGRGGQGGAIPLRTVGQGACSGLPGRAKFPASTPALLKPRSVPAGSFPCRTWTVTSSSTGCWATSSWRAGRCWSCRPQVRGAPLPGRETSPDTRLTNNLAPVPQPSPRRFSRWHVRPTWLRIWRRWRCPQRGLPYTGPLPRTTTWRTSLPG